MEKSKIKTALIDGYLDEPSCLGVPPYISPHIRYTYGSLLNSGIKEKNLTYITIDQIRQNQEKYTELLESFDLVIIIAGTTVPGHYLGGTPISLKEISDLGKKLYYPQKVIGGPVTLVIKNFQNYDHICQEIAALDLYQLLNDEKINNKEIAEYIGKWAVTGASLTGKHPSYPELVCEIETFRGCPRLKHCAFCSERLKKRTYQRTPEQIINEVSALAAAGNHNFRLGCQTDLLLYQAERNKSEFILNPTAVKQLYQGIRQADPELKVLHLDNINPANITEYAEKARDILQTIVKYNTAGDIAAFGLESADPVVLDKNNIESDPEKTLEAIKILNDIGGVRENGLPKLLPGINLLHGLIGEREETLDYNYQFLKKVYDSGLMLRRINIRQVVNTGNYPRININKSKFKKYKELVNKEINQPMLKRVFPTGTIINNVLTETHKGKLTYGRQLGSYPILIGIPGKIQLNKYISVRVIDHGYRSITALPWPFKIKEASIEQLAAIPGIGRKRAGEIFVEQPENLKQFAQYMDPAFPLEKWKDWFTFA